MEGRMNDLSSHDILAIHQLNAQFALAIDDLVPNPAVAWADTFTPDGRWIVRNLDGEVVQAAIGTSELRDRHDKFPERDAIRHWYTNFLIEPDAQGARMTCYAIIANVKDRPPHILRTAIYRDILVKRGGS